MHESGITWNGVSGDRLREWLGVTKKQFYSMKNFSIVPMGFSVIREKVNKVICLPVVNARKHGWLRFLINCLKGRYPFSLGSMLKLGF